MEAFLQWFGEIGALALAFVFFIIWGLVGAVFQDAFRRLHHKGINIPFRDPLAIFIGMFLGLFTISWLNCALFIEFPYTHNGCRLLGF